MLADMLLEMGRPEQALAEYEKSLKTDPNRFNGLYGAAQAAESAHDSEKAQLYYAQLLKNCENGQRPELARAKTLLAKQREVGSQRLNFNPPFTPSLQFPLAS